LLKEFPNKNWNRRGLHHFLQQLLNSVLLTAVLVVDVAKLHHGVMVAAIQLSGVVSRHLSACVNLRPALGRIQFSQ